MSSYFAVLLSLGILATLLLAVGAFECSEKETLLRPIPSTVTQITECLLECTAMTYIKKLQLQDNHNIRLKDSTDGDLGEYCWSTELKCTMGERLQHVYVVLPVDMSAVGHEQVEVKVTGPTTTRLHTDSSPTTLADNCGLRYAVTAHFDTEKTGTSFCIQIATQGGVLGDIVLKCPPFLVTIWQRSPNQSNQQSGG